MDQIHAFGNNNSSTSPGNNLPYDKNSSSKVMFISFMAIMATEIGDKTFLISAIMAMKHPRTLIFAGTMTAMSIMTLVSAYLGHVVPSFIDRKYTQLLAAILFLVFGFKMLKEAREMTGNESQEEMNEVNELLEKDQINEMAEMEGGILTGSNTSINETGDTTGTRSKSVFGGNNQSALQGIQNLMTLVFSPVFVQTFTLTFLAEWGDRSQIATIALASSENWWDVSVGSIMGHSICTAVAVIGGKLLAEKISIKTVTTVGGALFILFGLIAFYEFYKS